MATSHVDVQLLNCTGTSGVTEFLVEVVLTRAGGVTQQDSIILDEVGASLVDLMLSQTVPLCS